MERNPRHLQVDHPEPSSHRQRRSHNGDITMEQVTDIARVMRERSLAKELSGGVKEILGTCRSVGCTVDDQAPQDIIDQIDAGEIEIASE